MSKIAAVVVTFNRLSLLKGCIDSLRQQIKKVDTIIVVNNGSTDGTDVWLNEQSDLQVIHQKNTGGAGGFHTGIKEAYEHGYDWIWVMDDDCVANDDCLLSMFESLGSQKIYCVAPVVVERDGNVDVRHRGFFKFSNKSQSIHIPINAVNEKDITVDFSSFVGLMINSYAIKQVGLPMKDFFIHNDDVEYCLRLNQVSKILLSVKAKIYHLENATVSNVKKTFLSRSTNRTDIDKLWIKYYGVRNLIWIKKKYAYSSSPAKKASLLYFIITQMFYHAKAIAMYDDFKFKRIKFYLNAYRDGWRGEFDNERPKRILSSHLS